MTHRTRGKKQ